LPDRATPTRPPEGRTGTGLAVAAIALLFVACYFTVFASLVRQFRSNDVYSHGFLIPFISCYLILLQRDRIRQARIRPNLLLGIPFLAAGLLLLIAGGAAGVLILQEVSLLVTISGLVLLLFGEKVLRSTWFGIAYLLFMLPAWEILTNRIQFPFQMLSANIGVKLLELAGIPVYQHGVYIELPAITLEVARECSGVNYLISILAIGLPLSYIYISKWHRRIALVGTAVGIAILSNGFRVFVVSLFAYKSILGYNRDIHGPMHFFQALFVSAIGYLVIFLGVSVLKDRDPVRKSAGMPRVGGVFERVVENVRPVSAAVAIGLLLLAGSTLHLYRSRPVPLKTELQNFPGRIGDWSGRDSESGFPEFRRLGVDQELSRTYELPTGDRVALYVGYYDVQHQDKEIVNYRIDYLFDDKTVVKVPLNAGEGIEVNRNLLRGKKGATVVLYWIDIDGTILRDKSRAKLYTMRDALLLRKSNGAVVLVTTDGSGPGGVDAGTRLASEFLRAAYPVLREHLEN
jgi:EpsI family protein